MHVEWGNVVSQLFLCMRHHIAEHTRKKTNSKWEIEAKRKLFCPITQLQMSLYESIFQRQYHKEPHTQNFQGGLKRETTLRLAVPWPQLFADEKKAQGGATGELTPRRLQCCSDLFCDDLKFWPTENHPSQATLLSPLYSAVLVAAG